MALGRHQVTFDFRDQPQLLDMLKLMALTHKTTQKAIVADALTAYFSQKQESLALLQAAEKSFAEWDNEDDRAYDTL